MNDATTHAGARKGLFLRYGFALAGLGLLWFHKGVPFSWQLSALWCVAILLLVRPQLAAVRLIRDWAPLILILAAYQLTRGLADELHRPVYVHFPIAVERAVFGGVLGETLQARLIDPDRVHVWEIAPALVYASHFIAPMAVGAYLYARGRERFLHYRSLLTLTFGIALMGYVLCPLAPPWMAARLGAIPPLMRSTSRGWSIIGMPIAGDALDVGARSTNAVAAMPSLHAALPLIYLFVFWKGASWLGRVLLVLYPLAMGFTLVLGAEHYAIDVVAGWATAVAAALILGLAGRLRRDNRGTARTYRGSTAPSGAASALSSASPD